jgi:undecaprenyl-diphosphatase
MSILAAILLGIIEGVTEFLPISSTGHLTIAEKLMGLHINDPGVTAFTAIIQVGATIATIVYFRRDIIAIVRGFLRGLFKPAERRGNFDYRFGWIIIIGSVPIAVAGLLFKDQVETTFRSLWLVAAALILWSFVMLAADRLARHARKQETATWKDGLVIGLVQCLALIPGVSRSGATISAGLFRGFDRVAATKLSFFLAIPALVAASAFEAVSKAGDISRSVGWGPTIVSTIVTFFVAYASIAWLLRYVARHNFTIFIVYRIALGLLVAVLLATGAIAAT